MVTAFGKEIGYSLVAFSLRHQIVENQQVPFTNVYVLWAIQIVWDPMHKFYPRYSFLNVVVKRLPLAKTPQNALRWWLYQRGQQQLSSPFRFPASTRSGHHHRKRMSKGHWHRSRLRNRVVGLKCVVFIFHVSMKVIASIEVNLTYVARWHFERLLRHRT